MSKIQLKNATIEPYFHRLNLVVEKGSSLAISGENRLALFRTLAGFMQLEKGSYQLEYHRNETKTLHELAAVRQEKLGYVPKNEELLPKLTLMENIELPFFFQTGASSITAAKHQRLEQLCRLIGIHHLLHEKAELLNPFERKCTVIVRACINSPSILMLEEPTLKMTKEQIIHLIQFLRLLKNEGMTIIVSTTDETVLEYVDQTIVMEAKDEE